MSNGGSSCGQAAHSTNGSVSRDDKACLADPLAELKMRVDALFACAAGRVGETYDEQAQFVCRLVKLSWALLRQRFPDEYNKSSSASSVEELTRCSSAPGLEVRSGLKRSRQSVVCAGSWEPRRASVEQLEAELGPDKVYEEVRIELSPSSNDENTLSVRQFREYYFCSGCRIWDAGIALARHVITRTDVRALVTGQQLIEVGAGVGVAGLCAARLAKRVVLTDSEAMLLPNLLHNAARVQTAGAEKLAAIDVQQLNWADGASELVRTHGAFDVVLASDVVYSSGCVAALAACLASLLRDGGTLLQAYPHGRHGQQLFRRTLEAAGWRCAEERLDAALLRGCAHQGHAEEVAAHPFFVLRAVRPARDARGPSGEGTVEPQQTPSA